MAYSPKDSPSSPEQIRRYVDNAAQAARNAILSILGAPVHPVRTEPDVGGRHIIAGLNAASTILDAYADWLEPKNPSYRQHIAILRGFSRLARAASREDCGYVTQALIDASKFALANSAGVLPPEVGLSGLLAQGIDAIESDETSEHETAVSVIQIIGKACAIEAQSHVNEKVAGWRAIRGLHVLLDIVLEAEGIPS